MHLDRFLPPVMAAVAAFALATPAEARMTSTSYDGVTTINPTLSVTSDGGTYDGTDGSTSVVIDYADPRKDDYYFLSPSSTRHFTLTWNGQTTECSRSSSDNVYANSISVYGKAWFSGGTAAGNVRCVIGGVRYYFEYAENAVEVIRASPSKWELRSNTTTAAKVSTINSKGKLVPTGETADVHFDVVLDAG